MAPHGWVVDPLLEGALEVRDALGTTPETHLLAEVVAAFPADAALSARDADLQCHTIANPEARHLGADGHHHA